MAKKFDLLIRLNQEAIKTNIAYPVVVEAWERKSYGKGKRAYLAEFTEAERKKATLWYSRFHDWHLRRGVPENIAMKPETLNFIVRLCNFFAGV